MTDDDYTNPRWNVDGLTVTHNDFPGMKWNLALKDNAKGHASQPPNSSWTHAARAWIAAQPKPVPELGMTIHAELRGGATISGRVTEVSPREVGYTDIIVSGVNLFIDHGVGADSLIDVVKWHETEVIEF